MASSTLDRAVAIRDHVLPLIRERGARWPDEAIRIITWKAKPLLFVWQTPVSHSRKLKPLHELSVFCDGRRVMFLTWSDASTPELITFMPGDWKREALALH